MNCRNCGTVLNATDKFCLNCGTPVELPAPAAPVTPLVAPTPEQVVQMSQPAQEVPVVPVQPMTPQPIEAGIAEYNPSGLPVGQPAPEPEQSTIPVGPSLPVGNVAPIQPAPVEIIPGAPVAPTPGFVQPVQPVQPDQKKDNKKLFIIIGGILLFTAVVVVVLFVVFGKDKEKSEDNDKKDNDTNVKEPAPEVPAASTYQVSLGKFVFNIPTTYESELNTDYISLTDGTYYLEVKPFDGFTLMNVTKDEISSYLATNGITVVSVEEKTVNGNVYFVAHSYDSGIECTYIFTKSTAFYYLIGFGAKVDYTYGEDVVTELISVLEDIEYSSSNNLNTINNGLGNMKPIK